MPTGSARYLSWLFAAPDARDSLLGVYALMAEWRALADPATETNVGHIKLLWWRDELRRTVAGSATHPITRYLAQLPAVRLPELARLELSVDAAGAQIAGVPLERGAELASHANALGGIPLLVAARLRGAPESDAANACVAALGAADYLARALRDYGREARRGRIPFPVDELLRAEIDNDDLAADRAPPRLQAYLHTLRLRATDYYAEATGALGPPERAPLRHLAVLATLGARRLVDGRSSASTDFRLADLYNAWNAARHAAASH